MHLRTVFLYLALDIWPKEMLCIHGACGVSESPRCSATLSKAPNILQLTPWGLSKLIKVFWESCDPRITKADSSRTSLYHEERHGTDSPYSAKPSQVSPHDTVEPANVSTHVQEKFSYVCAALCPNLEALPPSMTRWLRVVCNHQSLYTHLF